MSIAVAIIMDPNILCSEDRNNSAVCSCFCRFPLPTLCKDHASKHLMDGEGFLHFHLPVYAAQWISTREIKNTYSEWLFGLNTAYNRMKENEDDIVRFEEQIEATKLEVLYQFEEDVVTLKKKVVDLREAFNIELQKARLEITTHALDQWRPEDGSLSAYIWSKTPAKLFRLWAGKGSQPLSRNLQVYIESYLPALAHYNQQSVADQMTEPETFDRNKYLNELSELRKENEALKVENAALKSNNKGLQTEYTKTIQELEALKKTSETQLTQLNAEITQLKAKSTCSIPFELEKAAAHKAAFRYKESANLMQNTWDFLQQSDIRNAETIAVGLLLAEVLGVHQARADDSLIIIEKCMQIQSECGAAFEETLNLRTLQATVNFLDGRDNDVETVCRDILTKFNSVSLGARHYWTALFFLVRALDYDQRANAMIREGLGKSFGDEGETEQLIKLSLKAKLAEMDTDCLGAERQRIEVNSLATNAQSTSIYAILNSLDLGKLYCSKMDKKEDGLAMYTSARSIADTHYPASSIVSWVLSELTDTYKEQKGRDEALAIRLKADISFTEVFPAGIATVENLIGIAKLYTESAQPQAALEKRKQAQQFFEAYHLTHLSIAWNISGMADLYVEMEQVEAAIWMREQARRFVDYYHRAADFAAFNLEELAKLYKEVGRLPEAEQACLDSRLHWVTHNPTSSLASWCLCNLGELCEEMGKTASAILCIQSALEIAIGQEEEEVQNKARDLLAILKNKK